MPLAASWEISHATKTGRDTRGASPFGSQKTRVGDVDASAQDESNAKTPVQKFKKRRLQIRKDSRSRFRLRVHDVNYFAWPEITGTTRANELRCYPGLSFGEDLYYPSVGVL